MFKKLVVIGLMVFMLVPTFNYIFLKGIDLYFLSIVNMFIGVFIYMLYQKWSE